MSNQNTTIRHIRNSLEYSPMQYGNRSGEPTVSIKLSSSDSNEMKVNSLENLFQSYNWLRKVNSGFARLRIYGDNPFSDKHIEGLDYLFNLIDPRFVDIEINASELEQEPSRVVDNKADTYTIVFDENDDELVKNEKVLEEIADRARSFGDTQFIFKANSVTIEDKVKQFSRDYQVYDSDIWLYPKGQKMNTTSESYDSLASVAKRNKWNLSPRMDLLANYEEE